MHTTNVLQVGGMHEECHAVLRVKSTSHQTRAIAICAADAAILLSVCCKLC